MSKADGTAFGRPFRPFIAIANSGNKTPYSSINSTWNEFMEPYYQNWAHPDDGIEFVIYLHVLYWSGFYVNDNNKPNNPTNQNDSAYDWSYLDGIEQGVDAIRLGKAKLHFRWDTERSGIPDFLASQGDTFDGTGGRPVPAWHRTNVQNDAKDFWTAFAARYNNASWLVHISHEEDNPGPNPPGDWTGEAWTSGRANVVRHTYNVLTGHTVFLGQSSGVHEHLDDIPVGRMMDDPKPGGFSCGSSHQAYPVFDCEDTIIRGIQDFNGTIENPPGGIPKPVFLSSMPNGWGSRNDGNYGSSNPWGVPYPIPGETSSPAPGTLGDPDWNAAQHLSYTSGEPRAPSPDDDSGLGQPGRDNAGVVPSMGVMVHPGNDTPQAWNRAFQLFGANGTRAAPAVPWDWEDGSSGGGGGGSGNEITVIQGFSTTESWLQAMMAAHTNTNLIAVIVGGGDIDYWLTGSNIADGVEESYSTNPGNKEDGDVIFFQVAGPQRSAAQWDTDIESALTTIRTVFTNLSRITLAPSPGGPDGALCPSDGANNINGSVRDSVTYNEIRSAITIVAARYTDVNWIECYCDSCSWYSDGIGHITEAGSQLLGEKMWNALFSGLPPPSEVIAVADTLAGVAKNSGEILISNSTLLANDTGDGLSITAVSDAQGCTVALDVANGRISYTPNTDFSGASTFRYDLSGDGGTSDTQVTIPVGNTAPTLNVTWTGPGIPCIAGQPVNVAVQGADAEGDVLTYQIDRQPDEGVLEVNSVVGQVYWLMTYTAPITSAGLVSGGQVSCTDDDTANPLKSNLVDLVFDVTPSEQFESYTFDEDQATVNSGTWEAPPSTVPEFGNVEGADWQVFRSQIHQDNIQVNRPTNASEGDTLLIVAAADGSLPVDMVVDPSAGWVNRYNRHESGTSVAVFDKVLTDTEPGVYTVRQGGATEEWCAFSIVLPPGSAFDSLGETSGISTTGQAPSITPTTANVMTLHVVASDDPDDTEDAYSFTGGTTMIGNKWSSNTGGMVSLAIGYDTQTVVQATGARDLSLDVDGRWTGLTLAYTQQLSGYSGAFGGDTLLNSTGDGTGSICYTNSNDAANEKNWLRVYAQWPVNSIASNAVRVTLNVGGVAYAEIALDQTANGGVMNQIYNITTPLPAGAMTVCLFDNAAAPVFADAVRFDYSVGEAGFVTFSATASASGHLKLSDTVAVPVNAYILQPGTSLFTFTTSCQANALIVRTQEFWDTLSIPETEWTTEASKQ